MKKLLLCRANFITRSKYCAFVQQFELVSGDYTKNRHQWLDQFTVEDIFNQVQHQREDSGQSINLKIADAS